jgi:DNA-binding response OmpR family regulator
MNAVEKTVVLLRSDPEWKCRVLIVDDDEIVRAQLRRLLKRAHFDVQVARSADEALHVLEALRFHILLTDVQMPAMDGLELCRKLRTGSLAPDLYIMVLTVRGTESDTLLSLVAGADDHIVKGSSNEAVLERMEFARNIARAHRAEHLHSC